MNLLLEASRSSVSPNQENKSIKEGMRANKRRDKNVQGVALTANGEGN